MRHGLSLFYIWAMARELAGRRRTRSTRFSGQACPSLPLAHL